MYSLFLDDLRTPDMIYPASTAETFVVVRSWQGLLGYFLLLICYSGLGKYEIQISNALSLRVILERLSARGLYREVI